MTDSQLEEAYAARQAGDDARVAQICGDVLAREPAHPGASSLLAVCLAEAGDTQKARPLAEQAVRTEPQNWRYLLNLSIVEQVAGDMEKAIELARRARDAAPDRFETWGRLGDLYGHQGNFAEAVDALQKAIDLNPRHAALALRLAGAAYQTGDYDKCGPALDRFEAVAPGHSEALRLRTLVAQKQGDASAMLRAASRWLQAEPRAEGARVALAFAYAQLDQYPNAVDTYRPLVAAQPDNAGHAATLAQYLLWARRFDEAERYYAKAVQLDPQNADAAAGLARIRIYRGDLAEAAKLAERAIAANPRHVEGYAQLASASNSRLSDEQISNLRALGDDPSMDPGHRAIAWFTAGDAYHQRKEHRQAFEAWDRANQIKRSTGVLHYDAKAMEQKVDRLIALFEAAEPAGGAANATAGPQPLFIIGMPRSGTTLVESALGAHPHVASGGELPAMPDILERFLVWADRSDWRGGAIPAPVLDQLRKDYRRQYETYGIEDAAIVTDKQPTNFLAVGLIRQLFPAARFVHTTRHPLETGFSIYRKNFTRSWTFTTSLPDIGHYYGQYARLVKHWEAVFSDAIATVSHADLVLDFETEIRRLVAHAGFEWDPACLNFHENKGIVTTLSAAQVRKAPSKAFLGTSAAYCEQLQPLRKAMSEAGVECS